ncbi:hypothetical protein [Leeia sp.]|uniref:DUF6911 family protein n=1 Tax=Leeia sp. TaxID=2884678 RepID=UPI0035AF986E
MALVFDVLARIFSGQVECLTLYAGDGQSMVFLGKYGLAHICLFVSDVEEYTFDNGTGDSTRVDVAGDYWPSFQLCRDSHKAEEIAKEFYVNGQPLSDQKWVHFVEDDE